MRGVGDCWSKQYSSRSSSAGRSLVEETGGEDGRDESIAGRESTGEDGDGKTKRGRRNRVVKRV